MSDYEWFCEVCPFDVCFLEKLNPRQPYRYRLALMRRWESKKYCNKGGQHVGVNRGLRAERRARRLYHYLQWRGLSEGSQD